MTEKSKMARTTSERREQQATSASGRRLRAQGQRTRESIVHEAKKLLLESGNLEFTLRTVARRTHIAISNLQYYFPTRASLLRAIMEPVAARYQAELDCPAADAAAAREVLAAVIDQNLADARDPEVSAIWLHFASLAVTDPESARILDESYETLARCTSRLLRVVNPSLSPKDSRLLARIIPAMVDGLGFQIGVGHYPDKSTTGLEPLVREIVDLLIEQFPRMHPAY